LTLDADDERVISHIVRRQTNILNKKGGSFEGCHIKAKKSTIFLFNWSGGTAISRWDSYMGLFCATPLNIDSHYFPETNISVCRALLLIFQNCIDYRYDRQLTGTAAQQ
jgi:hypothetical protein